jgi:hypothetical protein
LVAIAVVAAVALSYYGHSNSPSPSVKPSTPPNSGPFTGTFTAAMGPRVLLDGSPGNDRAGDQAFSETWRLRSACGASGCVATASTGSKYSARSLIFDKIDGRWVAVTTSRRKCTLRDDDEAWRVISLQPQPDGTFSGESTETTANGCSNKRTVVFTRTADTDVSQLPDPATLAPRVVSPAQALHGAYDELDTFANGAKLANHVGVRTDCLRTGDRCMAFFVGPKLVEPFVFGNGAWTMHEEYKSACPTGGDIQVKRTANLPLPQPAQDPITLLTGHGYDEVSPGSRCPTQAFDQKYTRTGD